MAENPACLWYDYGHEGRWFSFWLGCRSDGAIVCRQTAGVEANAGFQAPVLMSKVRAEYTPQARQAGIEGSVWLYVEIGTDGRAHNVRVTEGLGYGLDSKAVDAIRQWTFQPGEKDGVPVVTPVAIQVNFQLDPAGPKPVRV
jgi:TonB family protein